MTHAAADSTLLTIAIGCAAFALGALIAWLALRTTATRFAAEKAALVTQTGDLRDLAEKARVESDHLRTELCDLRIEHGATHARADADRAAFEREREAFAQQRVQLEQSFRAIGTEVIDANSRKVAELARSVLAEQQAVAKGDLDLRSQAVEKLVKPVAETLGKLDEQLRGIEIKRVASYEGLKTKIEALGASELLLKNSADELSRSTTGLLQALRSSGSRGQWGEMQLRRIVELAGMLEHCDFDAQVRAGGDDGAERPDLLIYLAGGRFVVVDAKAPLAAFLEAIEAPDEATRAAKYKVHARAVRTHINELARRNYHRHDASSPDFKVMFVPSEGALAAALSDDPAIVEDAIAVGVALASPTMLIALLRMMSLGWRQHALEDNSRKIAELGSELYERIGKVGQHLAKVGSSLGTTLSAYNELVGSVEGRLMVTGRRLQALGAVPASETLPEIASIERVARTVAFATDEVEVSRLSA